MEEMDGESYKTLEIVKPDGTSVLVTLDTATATKVLDGDVSIIQDILNSYDDTIAKVDDDDGAKFDGVDVTADDAIIDGIDATADGTDATADGTDATADGTDATADGTLDEHVPFADDGVEIKKENDELGSDNDVVTLGFIKKKKRKLIRNKKRDDADWHHPRVKKKRVSYTDVLYSPAASPHDTHDECDAVTDEMHGDGSSRSARKMKPCYGCKSQPTFKHKLKGASGFRKQLVKSEPAEDRSLYKVCMRCWRPNEDETCRSEGGDDILMAAKLQAATSVLQTILPSTVPITLCKYDEMGEGGAFEVLIHLPFKTKDHLMDWLNEFQLVSKTTLRKDKTFPNTGGKLVYKCVYRCQHRTRPPKKDEVRNRRNQTKNTNCPFLLSAKIRRTDVVQRKDAKDAHHLLMPAAVSIRYNHNHPIETVDVLKRRDISHIVKSKFEKLFESGHSPSSALQIHKYDLQIEEGSDYLSKAADRFFCPDVQWCQRVYYTYYHAEHGTSTGTTMVNALQKRIDQLNNKENGKIIATEINDEHMIIAICTPLMQRVHQQIRQSSNIVFVDSSGCTDTPNCHVFLLMTSSTVGGLPLGVVITTSETESVLESGFQLLKTVMPEDAFYGRAESGPQYFMTDDNVAERNALATAFPHSTTLLCQFHVLWALWRWLSNNKNGIMERWRSYLFCLFKDAVDADTSEALAATFTRLHNDEVALLHVNYIAYVDRLLDRSTLWATCYRTDIVNLGRNTKNNVRSSVRMLKDKIFNRLKAFNPVQLMDFLVTRLEQYYERQLMGICNNRLDDVKQSRCFPKEDKICLQNVSMRWPFIVQVLDEKLEHVVQTVNTCLWVCTCPIGFNGAPCTHQWAAITKYPTNCFNMPSVSSLTERKGLYYIATGRQDVPASWNLTPKEPAPILGKGKNSYDRKAALNVVTTEPTGDNFEDISNLVDSFMACANEMATKIRQYPATYSQGAQAFIENYHKITTSSGLLSAWYSFGKDLGGPAIGVGSGNKRPANFNETIGSQPTDLAKCTAKWFGRKNAARGRPSKSAKTTENENGKPRSKKRESELLPPGVIIPAPQAHIQTECVEWNYSLGVWELVNQQ